jgi:hypothetical protein
MYAVYRIIDAHFMRFIITLAREVLELADRLDLDQVPQCGFKSPSPRNKTSVEKALFKGF